MGSHSLTLQEHPICFLKLFFFISTHPKRRWQAACFSPGPRAVHPAVLPMLRHRPAAPLLLPSPPCSIHSSANAPAESSWLSCPFPGGRSISHPQHFTADEVGCIVSCCKRLQLPPCALPALFHTHCLPSLRRQVDLSGLAALQHSSREQNEPGRGGGAAAADVAMGSQRRRQLARHGRREGRRCCWGGRHTFSRLRRLTQRLQIYRPLGGTIIVARMP